MSDFVLKLTGSIFVIQVMAVVMFAGSKMVAKSHRRTSMIERYSKRAEFFRQLAEVLIWPVTFLLIVWIWVRF